MYISNKYHYEVNHDINADCLPDCESVWVTLFVVLNNPVTVGTLYRHPRNNIDNRKIL